MAKAIVKPMVLALIMKALLWLEVIDTISFVILTINIDQYWSFGRIIEVLIYRDAAIG